MSAPNNKPEPDLRDFYETEEEYQRFKRDPQAYINAQIKEIKDGAAKYEASLSASKKAALTASAAEEKNSGTSTRKRRSTLQGSAIGGSSDGISVKDFAVTNTRKENEEPKESDEKKDTGLKRQPKYFWPSRG